VPRKRDDVRLAAIVAKLKWGAEGEFSASVKPWECALLLEELQRPPSRRRTKR
jgi:hypothetical protein